MQRIDTLGTRLRIFGIYRLFSMSRAKENANLPKWGTCRIGATKHEAVVERETRARVRVSLPNARVSRFSLASPEKREKITPVLQAKNHPRRPRGR